VLHPARKARARGKLPASAAGGGERGPSRLPRGGRGKASPAAPSPGSRSGAALQPAGGRFRLWKKQTRSLGEFLTSVKICPCGAEARVLKSALLVWAAVGGLVFFPAVGKTTVSWMWRGGSCCCRLRSEVSSRLKRAA